MNIRITEITCKQSAIVLSQGADNGDYRELNTMTIINIMYACI